MKVTTTVRIDKEILEKAKEEGIVISKFLESKLKEEIERRKEDKKTYLMEKLAKNLKNMKTTEIVEEIRELREIR